MIKPFKIFLASAEKSKKYVEEIAGLLEEIKEYYREIEIYKWWNIFDISSTTLETVLNRLREFDAGIFILGKDDYVCNGDRENIDEERCCSGYYIPRDNVLVETGIFLGMQKKDNVCLCSIDDVKIPSDLRDIVTLKYDISSPERMKNKLIKWINNIISHRKKSILVDTHGMDNIAPVFISERQTIEKILSLPEREEGAKEIFIVNFAGTSFLANDSIAYSYEHSWNQWFNETLVQGYVNITLVITKENSFAAQDAEKYKMYPSHITIDKSEIISANRKKIGELRAKYKNIKLVAKETDIALPYALIETRFEDEKKNHIKVDLYSPLIYEDKKRPCFMVYKNENAELYNHFANVISSIVFNSDTID